MISFAIVDCTEFNKRSNSVGILSVISDNSAGSDNNVDASAIPCELICRRKYLFENVGERNNFNNRVLRSSTLYLIPGEH